MMSRRPTVWSDALAILATLLALSGLTTEAQADDLCRDDAVPSSKAVDPSAFWESDRIVSVSRHAGDTGTVFRIVGDIVELNDRLFPSLKRTPGQSLTGIESITVEAREIIVAMPLLLSGDATLRLVGETVRFTFGGYVAFVDAPMKAGQALEIRTETLDFAGAKPTPFAFMTQDWKPIWSEATWPTASGRKRTLSVHARAIVPRREEAAVDLHLLEEEPVRYLHNKTLDVGRSSGRPKDIWSKSYDLRLGAAGSEEYAALLRKELLWPDHSTAKLERLFARSPYDPTVRAFVSKMLAEIRIRIAARWSKATEARLARLETSLINNLDTFGYGPHDVPMQNLSARLQGFERLLSEALGNDDGDGLIAIWDQLRVTSLTGGAVDSKTIDRLDRDTGTLKQELDQVAARIALDVRNLEQNANKVEMTLLRTHERQKSLEAEWNRKQEQLKQIGEATQAVRFVGVGVSIVFPAAAPVVMAGSQAITTAGELVYQHNSGKDVTLATAAKTIEEVNKEFSEYKEKMKGMRSAWQKSEENFSNAWDEVRGKGSGKGGLSAYVKAVGEYTRAASEVFTLMKAAGTRETLKLPDFAANDEEIKSHIASLEKLRSEEAVLRGDLADLQARHQTLAAGVLEREAVRRELLALDLRNDEARRRLAILGSYVRTTTLGELARAATVLRRGMFYVTGKLPEIADSLLWYADDRQAMADVQMEPKPVDELEAALRNDRRELRAAYKAFAVLVGNSLQHFKTRLGWRPPVPIVFSASAGAKESVNTQDQPRREFLSTVNTVLETMTETNDPDTDLSRFAIRIPFEPRAPSVQEPETLLAALVTRVDFAEGSGLPEGEQIILTVEHPRIGWMTYPGGCRLVQDAALRESPFSEFQARAPWPSEVPVKEPDWRRRLEPDWIFVGANATALPYRAPYYLFVELPMRYRLSKAPVIDRIDITFVKTGPKP